MRYSKNTPKYIPKIQYNKLYDKNDFSIFDGKETL